MKEIKFKKGIKNALKIFSVTAILATGLVVTTACGSSTDPTPTPSPSPVVTPTPSPSPSPTPTPTPEPPALVSAIEGLPFATAEFTPGSHTISVPGWGESTMYVLVEFSTNQITNIEVVDHNESMYGSGWGFRAMPATQDQILVRQSTLDIDAFTGATATRNSIITAVEEAIVAAGAQPSQLEPQFITAPLAGDRFIPGFIEITVPANTMDIYGNALTDGAMRMLYSEDTDMNLRLSFGRNEFHLHSGGGFGLGQGNAGHGESVSPNEVGGGTWGSWWFRQVVNHQVNDRQSTQGIDIYTGATMSAAAIIWGVEQGMIAQGANPATIMPRTTPVVQIERNPSTPDAPFFVPGIYTVTVEGYGGPMEVRVTVDRSLIRRIEVLSHNEPDDLWDMVWGAPASHVMRDAIFQANAANIDTVEVVEGAEASSQALIDAVLAVMELASV